MTSRLAAIAAFVVCLPACDRQARTPEPEKDHEIKKLNDSPAIVDPLTTERDLKALQGKWELVSQKCDWVEVGEVPCYYVFEGSKGPL
jgi:hypothetical protein